MSVGRFLQQAAAGNAGGATYVDDVFSTYLYDGNGSTQTITNGIDLDGEGGMVWIKNRDAAVNHQVHDTERGASVGLNTNTTNAQFTDANAITSFNADGFSMNNNYNSHNQSGVDFCSWTFRKQRGFFDVVTYSGNGSARTISHNLGSVPGMILVKSTSHAENWFVFHTSTGPTKSLILESNGAVLTRSDWNNTAPTDSVFTVGSFQGVNGVGKDFVAYLFAHDAQNFGTDSDESIIKCGSYTGNGSTNGPEVDLGFEAQWVLIKNIGATGWIMADNMRGMSSGGNDPYLRPNESAAEYTTYDWIQPTATGFKLTNTGTSLNSNGSTYVYVAIRRPHKPASEFAATDLFDVRYGQNTTPVVTTGFPVDFFIERNPTGSDGNYFISRLTGINYLQSNSSGTGGNTSLARLFDFNDGVMSAFSSAASYLIYSFRRAPGFFDVVTYTGTGTAGLSINHNLGVTPEMMIVKRRNSSQGWAVYHQYANASPATGACQLESTIEFTDSAVYWNDTAPTDTVFTLGSSNITNNNSDTYIAYLFATVPGISKVGAVSHTTGSTTDVDCGFSSGARFVLVKRVDNGGGHWVVVDSVRGINAGNDPYLLLSSTAAQVTNQDVIDPLSSGFQMQGFFATGTWLFLAIA